jgi:hypothetical protein
MGCAVAGFLPELPLGPVSFTDPAMSRCSADQDLFGRFFVRNMGFLLKAKGIMESHTVYSVEQPRKPVELQYDGGKGFRCVCPQKDDDFFN